MCFVSHLPFPFLFFLAYISADGSFHQLLGFISVLMMSYAGMLELSHLILLDVIFLSFHQDLVSRLLELCLRAVQLVKSKNIIDTEPLGHPFPIFPLRICYTLGKNTNDIWQIQRSSNATIPSGSYVSKTVSSLWSPAVIQQCPSAPPGTYIVSPCVQGTSASLGSPTSTAACSAPADGTYVTKICVSGTTSTSGSNTVTKPCSATPAGMVATASCNPGTFSSLGWDSLFVSYDRSYLLNATGGYNLCPAGSYCKSTVSVTVCKSTKYCAEGSFSEVKTVLYFILLCDCRN
jgi:hypothetical protein